MNDYAEAIKRLKVLIEQAAVHEVQEPTAMTLATADAQGKPSARTVLLKDVDEQGFVFYTNSLSRKGKQLKDNPHAALCFFWQPLMQQVLIEGIVELIAADEADAYWATRPRDSQLGAWASQQSEPLENRQELLDRLEHYQQSYEGQHVPRPPHWLGYRLIPERIEFWKSGWHRLHERLCYLKTDSGWTHELLNP